MAFDPAQNAAFDVDIAVLGGGASGLMAALTAKEYAPDARVVIFERQNRVGKKLLATGNGRCNLLNTDITPEHYHGDVRFLPRLRRLCPPETMMRMFQYIGIEPRVEYGGRVYPMSGQAASVLDDLRLALSERGVEERVDMPVTGLHPIPGGVELRFDVTLLRARTAIACFGGAASPHLGGTAAGLRLLQDLGHSAEPFLPALTGLKTDPSFVRSLKGVRLEAEISVLSGDRVLARSTGDIIFSESGVSGTAAMAVSRAASMLLRQKAPCRIRLDLLPGVDVRRRLHERRAMFPHRQAGDFLTGLIHKKLGQALLRLADPDLPFAAPCAQMSDRLLDSLAGLLQGWELPLTDTTGMEQAQVTAGGVRLDEIDPDTMASRRTPGLYLAGEVLNIDGDCGGFNLYWAWATGYVAGKSAARQVYPTKQK